MRERVSSLSPGDTFMVQKMGIISPIPVFKGLIDFYPLVSILLLTCLLEKMSFYCRKVVRWLVSHTCRNRVNCIFFRIGVVTIVVFFFFFFFFPCRVNIKLIPLRL